MTYIIAEVGINHNGDINIAKELIKLSAMAGANAVKFQKRTVNAVYTEQELAKYRESPWGTTNRQQKEGLELDIDVYKELQDIAQSYKLDFIVSCWDLNSLQEVNQNLNVKYHKIASALATDKEFLTALNETQVPVILSVGMCNTEEIEKIVGHLDNIEYILACTSTYPTQANEVNLQHITTLKDKYPHIKVGFSNHYNGHDACVGAIALGAECVEFHITQDRTMYGSDQSSSIEKPAALVNAIRKMMQMRGDGVKQVYESELPIIKKLRKKNNI